MIGIDIVKVDRIAQRLENAAFIKGVFTSSELDYYVNNGKNPQTLSGLYAAKEAISKALGTGISGFSLKDIEILHNYLNAPYSILYGKAKELLGKKAVNISITHDAGIAIAVAVLA